MKTLSKLGIAIGGAVAIGAVSTTFSSTEAYAASLNGGISFTGTVVGLSTAINPAVDTVKFQLPTAVNSATGDFFGFGLGDITSLASTTINRVDGTKTNSNGVSTAQYSFGSIPNFVKFSNGYRFALDAGSLTRSRFAEGNPPLVSLFAAGFLKGSFISASDEVVGLGSLGISAAPDENSSYTITLASTPVPVPTPALLPGLIGVGVAALRRKQDDETAEENA